MKTHTRPIKGNVCNKKISVIIPTAGIGKKMKSFGTKALLDIGDKKSLIEYQIDIIKQILPNAEIIVVVGFEGNKVLNILPKNIRGIENENFETTTIVRSISLGLRASVYNNILILPGDIFCDKSLLEGSPWNKSFVILDQEEIMPKETVGVICNNSKVLNFAYTLPIKWTSISYFSGKESESLQELIHNKKYYNKCYFEILNDFLKQPNYLHGHKPKNIKLTKISTPKDLISIRK